MGCQLLASLNSYMPPINFSVESQGVWHRKGGVSSAIGLFLCQKKLIHHHMVRGRWRMHEIPRVHDIMDSSISTQKYDVPLIIWHSNSFQEKNSSFSSMPHIPSTIICHEELRKMCGTLYGTLIHYDVLNINSFYDHIMNEVIVPRMCVGSR